MTTRYDVVIIGAGLGGLICGNYLARGGHKVAILERAPHAGGLVSGFRRQGFYFNSGPQSLPSAGVIFPILRELKLFHARDWDRAPMTLALKGKRLPISSFPALAKSLEKLYPQEGAQLRSLFPRMEEAARVLATVLSEENNIVFQKGAGRLAAFRVISEALFPHMETIFRAQNVTFPQWAREYLKNEELAQVLDRLGYPGMTILFKAYLWHLFMSDYWYPRSGFAPLVERLVRNFRRHHGELKLNTPVLELATDREGVIGVKTGAGKIILAKKVIHSGDQKDLFQNLVPRRMLRKSFLEEVKTAGVSESSLTVYLGLKCSSTFLSKYLSSYHTILAPEEGVKLDPLAPDFFRHAPLLISAPGLGKTHFAPPRRTTLTLQSLADFRWRDNWGCGEIPHAETPNTRMLELEALEQMVDNAVRRIPGLKEQIVYASAATPLTIYRTTGNYAGASAGWSFDPRQSFLAGRFINLVSPVKNLYLAGHYAFWPGGLPAAALTGKLCAEFILAGKGLDLGITTFRIAKKIFEGLKEAETY